MNALEVQDHAIDGAYEDSIALLQDEIARLEEELRLRDERLASAPSATDSAPDAALEQRVATLLAEVRERDDIISLLEEQILALEEARHADHAEWDLLSQWVDAFEDRFKLGEGSADMAELAAARREHEAREEGWKSRVAAYEREIENLRARLAEAGASVPDQLARERLRALEAENEKLAREHRELAAGTAELGPLQESLDQARQRIEAAEAERDQAREALQVERARRLAAQSRGQPEPAPTTDRATLTPNERLRALRQHLNEIQQREEEERRQRTLSARLARLWNRSPARGA